MRTERESDLMILRGGESSAGGRRRGRGGRERGGRSKGMSLAVASTFLDQLFCALGVVESTYLILHKYSPEAVEELKWRDDVTLDEHGGDDCSCGPVPRAGGHLIEPLLQWELSYRSASSPGPTEHIVHVHDCGAVGRREV